MSKRTTNLIQIAVIIISLMAAFILASHPADAASECNRWAYAEGEDGYPDSIIMKTIGCDDGYYADGDYERAEGQCAAIARSAYRTGIYEANSAALRQYMRHRGCVTHEDGSYEPVGANR